jgi:hypothetical protein
MVSDGLPASSSPQEPANAPTESGAEVDGEAVGVGSEVFAGEPDEHPASVAVAAMASATAAMRTVFMAST